MVDAQEPGAIPRTTTIPAPAPVPAEIVHAEWGDLARRPEVACTSAWISACRQWWLDDRDHRLRDLTLDGLFIGPDELAGWLGDHLDPATLIRAHGHVTSMRAGVERDVSHRHLSTGALRTGAVLAEHRRGARTVFTAPENVPALVDRLGVVFDRLPEHPLVRAAWLAQAIGAVHPFRDSNGGTSRFLASLELARYWLPPLNLSSAQRNGPYIDALMHANRTGKLDQMALIVHDVVQRGVAVALLSGVADPVAWDDRGRARACRWVNVVDRSWRGAVGAPLDEAIQSERANSPSSLGAALTRLVRRGYRLPAEPAPVCARWSLPRPLPTHLDLAIAPLRGGATTWLVAVVAASVGHDGQLGTASLREPVEAMLVAPADEPDDVVEARFDNWIALRLDQCVRGLSHWM